MSSNSTSSSSNSSNDGYPYFPGFAVSVLFATIFTLTTAVHLVQALYFRTWFLLVTVVLCGIAESTAYVGRAWAAKNGSWASPIFSMQISITIIAPTLLAAANFIILGKLIRRLGSAFSRLGPKAYASLFISIDLLALFVQGGGAGIASADQNSGNPNVGAYIMLGGIVIQLIAIVIYASLGFEFFFRFLRNKPIARRLKKLGLNSSTPSSIGGVNDVKVNQLDEPTRKVVIGLCLTTLFLFIRSVFRTVELSDGWSSPVIGDLTLFYIFDTVQVILVFWTLNVLHPGALLRTPASENSNVELRQAASFV